MGASGMRENAGSGERKQPIHLTWLVWTGLPGERLLELRWRLQWPHEQELEKTLQTGGTADPKGLSGQVLDVADLKGTSGLGAGITHLGRTWGLGSSAKGKPGPDYTRSV